MVSEVLTDVRIHSMLNVLLDSLGGKKPSTVKLKVNILNLSPGPSLMIFGTNPLYSAKYLPERKREIHDSCCQS